MLIFIKLKSKICLENILNNRSVKVTHVLTKCKK